MAEKKIYMFSKLDLFVKNEEVELPPAYRQSVRENWDNEIKNGKTYNNGRIYTISGYNFNSQNKTLYIQLSDYSHYLYSRKTDPDVYSCRSLAANALFLTNDNYLVLGKMRDTTSFPGKIKFIGGAVSEDDIADNGNVDTLGCMKRECREEVGIDPNDKDLVKRIEPLCYITRPHFTFLNTLFLVELNISKAETESVFNEFIAELAKTDREIELSKIVFVRNDKDDILRFINDENLAFIDYMKDFFTAYADSDINENIEEYIKNNIREIKE